MEEIVLKAEKRQIIGKQVRALRRDGKMPAVIYGHGIDPLAISLDVHEASILLPGIYNMRYESPRYISQHVYGIPVGVVEATRVDVSLQPAHQIDLALEIVDAASGEIIPGQIKMAGVSFDTSFYYDGGLCNFSIPADIYLMKIYADGYIASFDPLEAVESGLYEIPLTQFSSMILAEDFESGLDNWLFGGPGNRWGLYNPGYESANCLADSPDGTYIPYANTYMESEHHPNFEGFQRSGIHYKINYDIEYHYDMAVLEYSVNNGPWFNLGDTLTGSSNGIWEHHYADLDHFCLEEVSSLNWGFRMAADYSIQYDGIYIDDIVIGAVEDTLDIDEKTRSLPLGYKLEHNYPNPFNASTVFKYELPRLSHVIIDIYDILGRKVTTLVDKKQPAGHHRAIWNANDYSTGVYFYRLVSGNYIETKKMLLLK